MADKGETGGAAPTQTSDRGASRAKWIAFAFLLLVVGWMGSGFVLPAEEEQPVAKAEELPPPAVAVRQSTAEDVTLRFIAEGQALPERDTVIISEAGGDVAEVPVRKGAELEQGDVVARLDQPQLEADLERAQEALDRAERDFNNAEQLLEEGVVTVDRLAETRVARASAQADLSAARQRLENAVIRAPFAGRLEALDVDPGETITAGAEIGRIVDNDPLTIAFEVPQRERSRIEAGQTASIAFVTGEELEGTVDFVATNANPDTRTFAAEIVVPNPDGRIPAGVSAQVTIPTGKVEAHFVSPAILSLGTDGTLGIKTVGEDDTVVFHPVSIVSAETTGIYVAGLPDRVEIITVGQGFVSDGEAVTPQT